MSEGGTYASLRQRYTAALSSGENSLRALLGSSSSSWKPVQTVTPKPAVPAEGDAVLSKTEEGEESLSGIASAPPSPIAVHRKRSKGAPDVVRAVCTVPLTDAANALDSFRAILGTHSIREKWDPVVERQEILEIVEPSIKLVQTFTKMGWPSSARDIVTVDKILHDPGKTLIYLSVSLPRSSGKGNDDPPFLQPSPPYIRSHMHICAFVLTCSTPTKAKLSMYWQWDLKGSGVVWTNHINAMPKIVSSLVDHTRLQAFRIPYVRSWGKGVTFDSDLYDAMQDRLELHYGIFVEEAVEDHDKNHVLLEKSKERRRLERSIEITIPPVEGSGAGWNVTMPSPAEGSDPTWQVIAERSKHTIDKPSRITLRIMHSPPKEDFLPSSVEVQRLAGGKSLKLNGEPLAIVDVQERDPAAFTARTANTTKSPEPVKPATSVLAVGNGIDTGSQLSVTTATTAMSDRNDRTSQAQKDLLAHIRRSYAHFLSLLQSPPAKWRHLKDLRSVSISSYIAIDPAMTPIYKYEATFVNTTMWDLLSVISSGGSRLVWDRQSGLERFNMLAELQIDTIDGDINPNQESAGEGRASFWEAGWKAMWPTAAREAVFVRTTYRSPTSIHLLQTSVPDDEESIWQMLAGKIPPTPEGVHRLQSQLQSVALDQISPTTTSVVLVDQTNPKSWTKSGYNAMANAVANIGEFALKEGAPPLLTHLSGATASYCSYEHERNGKYDLRYTAVSGKNIKTMESVLRLDLDVWSPAGASMTIEPSPTRISAVSRHRLSEKGSGCWITIEHQRDSVEQDEAAFQVLMTVERSNDSSLSDLRSRQALTVNGEAIRMELEELNDEEIQTRRMQKRVANRAIMLDRSPTSRNTTHFGRPPSIAEVAIGTPTATSRAATPTLHKRMSSISDTATAPLPAPAPSTDKWPIHYAFEALSSLQRLYKETSDARTDASEWTILSYAENNSPIRISKRVVPSVSPLLPLYRVERTLPNVSEEQLLRLIQSTSSNVRTSWDERLSSTEGIAYYENGCSTSIWIAQASFPTRSRIAYAASIRAREAISANQEVATEGTSVTYVASASVPLAAFELDCLEDRAIVASERLNPSKLLEASVPLEGWVIETSTVAKDDDEEDSAPQTYTKCSFFTCSDLPLMMAGAFGQAALRTRLAKMFDLLETSSKLNTSALIPRSPPSMMRINAVLSRMSGNWKVQQGERVATIIAGLPNSVILKIKLPGPVGRTAGSVTEHDAVSLPGGSGISQRSLGRRSMEARAQEPIYAPVETRNGNSSPETTTGHDAILAEIVLTRDPGILGYDLRSVTALPGNKILPTDTSFWDKLTPIPFKARIYPLSGPAKTAQSYLLRVSLPTGQFTSPMEHPLSALSGTPALPRWYRKLSAEPGIVQLQASTIKAPTQPDGRPPAALKFTFDGMPLSIVSDTESIPHADQTWHLDELVRLEEDRAPPPDGRDVCQPAVVNTAFLKHPPSRHKESLQSPGPTSPPLIGDLPPPSLNEAQKDDGDSSPKTADTNKQPLVDLFTATVVTQLGDRGQPGARTVRERTYRLAFVILVAVISFLLGSLLRSLLSPGDYIFFTRPLDSMEAAVWELLNPQKKWKYAMRLIQIPIPGIKRDFVAALVETD